jgi:hypothetical protein
VNILWSKLQTGCNLLFASRCCNPGATRRCFLLQPGPGQG